MYSVHRTILLDSVPPYPGRIPEGRRGRWYIGIELYMGNVICGTHQGAHERGGGDAGEGVQRVGGGCR